MSLENEPQQLAPVKYAQFKNYPPNNCQQKYSFMLIRPPRFVYNPVILNPYPRYAHRYTHQIYNIPFPLSLYRPQNMKYIVLYLHGNSSCRYQGFNHISNLPEDVGLACFDFNGCGLRAQKKYISLGKFQSLQVDIAAQFLKKMKCKIVGWGRSMGSVSLLLSSQCDLLVVDSPYSSLKELCKQVAAANCPCALMCCFHCMFPCFFSLISSDVYKKTQMNPSEMQILDHVSKLPGDKSILFLAAKNDTMINCKHAQLLYTAYNGKKKLILFQGNHNSSRSQDVMIEAVTFIQDELFQQQPQPESITCQKINVQSKKQLPQMQSIEMNKYFRQKTQEYTKSKTQIPESAPASIGQQAQLLQNAESNSKI